MLKIDTLERSESEQYSELAHRQALLNALAPDPAAWEYRGEVVDGGTDGKAYCACGHPIRWIFPVYRGSEMRPIGSTCINHYATVSAEQAGRMQSRLDETQAAIRDAAKQARAAAMDIKAQAAGEAYRAAYDSIVAIHRSFRDSGRRSPREIWAAVESYHYGLPNPSRPPRYQRKSALVAWYEKHIAAADAILSRYRSGLH
jgi:hypothetical protein